jgi:hypothetical protein
LRIVSSLTVVLIALLLGCRTADVATNQIGAAPTMTPTDTQQVPAAAEWLVKLRPGTSIDQVAAHYKAAGLIEFKAIAPDLYLLRFTPKAQITETRMREIGGDALLYVQPNYTYHTF